MKGILRSVFDYGDIKQPELIANLQKLIPSRIDWTQPADKRLYNFAVQYFHQRLEVPSRETLTDYFELQKDLEVVERIKDLDSVKPYVRTNFQHLLHVTVEEQNKYRALALLKESAEIISKGLIIDKEKKQGLKEGVLHFTQNAHKLLLQEHAARIQGDILRDGQEVWDEYQAAKANKGLAWGKFCGINNIDKVVKGAKKGELWVHAAYSGELKCLAGDATVFDHRTQRRRRLKEMFDCGDLPIVSAIEYEGNSTRLVITPASHLVQNGEREVFDLTLSSGRTVGATDNHKFLTPDGWVELKDLREGDFVATPKQLRAEGNRIYTEYEVKLVGYLIGDGAIKDCIKFTQEDGVIRDDFVNCLREMGLIEGDADYENPFFSVNFPKDRTPYVRVGHGLGDRWHRVTSPVRVLLERLGLYGTDSYDKRIPSEFFGLPEDLTAILLGALWSTDGSCSTGDYVRSDREDKKGGPQSSYIISYASVSHGLCLDIQSLLLRLGIQSTVTFVDTEVDDQPYRFWVTRIVTNPGKIAFCSKVRVIGKEDAFSYLSSRVPDRDTTMLPSSLLPEGKRIKHNGYWRYTSNHKRGDTVTAEMAAKFDVDTGDIYWDRVKKVVSRGVEMTYDLSVPGHHTFVANDIITHNTTYALNWAYNLVTRYRTNVYYATLEMPYEQIRTQVYVMHSSNARFVDKGFAPLDYEKVKSGQLDDDESEFYALVIRDFNNNEDYGSFEVFCPDTDVSIDDIRVQAEISHNEHEIGLLVIDHGGLVEARKSKKGRDYVIELNSVIRDAKKLALHFNHGEKVPVLLLFQINREGKDYADKNEGRYKLRALAYANECVVEGTLVKTNVGLIPIEEVRPGEHRVWSSSGWKPVLHHFDQGLRQTYRTTTKNGLELVSTGSHMVRVLKEEALDWAEVSALKAGDFVLCDVGTRPFPELSQPLPSPNFLRHEKAFGDDGRRIIFPEVFSDDLAYFLGVHAGDGSKVEGHIRITGNRKEVSLRGRVSSVFEGLFSQILNLSQSPSRPGSWDLGKQSVPLWRWCRRIGMDRGTNLHPNILRMTKVQTIHFLRGLWDADGSINTQGNLYLSQKASKKSMLQEVQLLMFDLGVESSLTTGWTRLKGKRYERAILTITNRKSRAVFATDIGFTEEHKQARLEFFVASRQDSTKSTGGVVWPVGDTLALVVGRYIPEPSRKVRSALKKWGVSHHPISDGAFREVLSLTSSLSGDSDLDRLRALSLLRPYCVKSVEPCGEGKVYDLEVSGDHEYSTGGFLSHNCERSADLVSTTYLNEDHRREGTTVFDCLKRRDGPLFASFVAKIDWLTRRISNMEGLQGISDLGMTIDDARDLHDTSLEMFD